MEYLIKGETLDSIANAIRAKTGKSNKILLVDFPNEIAGISGGGSGGEKPTLFAPSIELNSVSSILTITDDRNGDFEIFYDIYANNEFITTLSSKTATLNEYIEHTETMEVKVQAKGEGFENSRFSNSVSWIKFNYDGTQGLEYTISSDGTYATCNGIGTATTTEIEIASEYSGVPVTRIKSYSFMDNTNITSVVIPPTVTDIREWSFGRCSNLVNVELSVGTESLRDSAFNMCTSLTCMVIPNSVFYLGDYVFYSASNLKRVDFSKHTSIPRLLSQVFDGTHSTLQIKVPANLIDSWKSATNWANYANKIVTEFTNEV